MVLHLKVPDTEGSARSDGKKNSNDLQRWIDTARKRMDFDTRFQLDLDMEYSFSYPVSSSLSSSSSSSRNDIMMSSNTASHPTNIDPSPISVPASSSSSSFTADISTSENIVSSS